MQCYLFAILALATCIGLPGLLGHPTKTQDEVAVDETGTLGQQVGLPNTVDVAEKAAVDESKADPTEVESSPAGASQPLVDEVVSKGLNVSFNSARYQPVAFRVSMVDNDLCHGVAVDTVPYNRVYLNYGGGWDSSAHRFVAPIPGIYVFHAQGMSCDYAGIRFRLERGGPGGRSTILRCRQDNDDDDARLVSCSIHAVVQLQQNDGVWISLANDYTMRGYHEGNIHNAFSGFLYAAN